MPIYRVKQTARGTVTNRITVMGGEMMHIIKKEPTTVTMLVMICTRSEERLVVTTSMS